MMDVEQRARNATITDKRAGLSALAATVRTELTLRLRNPTLPVLLAFLFAVCALLVPDPAAHYAVVTIGQKKPIMSADTALVAAGIVFGALLLPVYALVLDIGNARDRGNMLDRLYLTSPANPAVVSTARLLASMTFVIITALLALFVVSSTVVARYKSLPAPSAAALFLLIVVPIGMVAALLAAVLDRFLPERNSAKTALAFAAWIGAVMASIAARPDLFGMSYVRDAMAPPGSDPAFSVGVVTTQGMSSIPWQTAPLASEFALSRLGLIALMTATAVGFGFLLRLRMNPTAPAKSTGGVVAAPGAPSGDMSAISIARPTTVASVASVSATASASAFATMRGIVARWLTRSRIAWAAIVITLLLGIRPGGAPGAALAVALTIPMIITSRTSLREARVSATLEMTTAAFFRPSPALMHGWVLALIAIAPALPALARMPVLQAATAMIALIGFAMWLTWTHRCVSRPLLGISSVAVIWYANAFNNMPAQLDILGLRHASTTALLIATVAACGMILLVRRHDRRALR